MKKVYVRSMEEAMEDCLNCRCQGAVLIARYSAGSGWCTSRLTCKCEARRYTSLDGEDWITVEESLSVSGQPNR